MKKLLWVICFLLTGCAVPARLDVTDPALIRAHPQPVTIFGIGYWGKDRMVLTLTDAQHQYFIVKVPRNDQLRTGTSYTP